MSALSAEDVAAYLRANVRSGSVDLGLVQSLVDTAEALVAERVGPLASGSRASIVFGGPSFVLPSTTTAVASATDLDGNVITSGFKLGVGGVVTNSACALGTWTLVYTAGYSTLPAPIRTAVLELVRHLWRPQLGTAARPSDDGAPGYLIPNRVRELLDPYALPGFA